MVESKESKELHFTRDSERNIETHELVNPLQCCQLYKKLDFFSIMVNESSDVSNREQVVFFVRWVDEDLHSHEDFVDLYEMEKTYAPTMAVNVIKDILRRCQCYYGCSTMMGKKKRVATLIK